MITTNNLIQIRILSLILCYLMFGCEHHAAETVPSDNAHILVSKDNLYSTVEFLANSQPARNNKNIDALNKVAAYISNRFHDYGYRPDEQRYTANGLEYKNIIASYGPEQAPRFIIGAHYDVYGELPGADDNASGVAGLLELARLFGMMKPEIYFRIDFVAFTLEEPPYFRSDYMGSYVHAKGLNDNDVSLLGMASLEMIGYFTNEPDSQTYPLARMKGRYPSTGNFIAVVGDLNSSDLVAHFKKHLNSASLPAESLSAPDSVPGVDLSDHMNYWKFNNKAIMVTDTSMYRNNNYHRITDTIDTLDFGKMAAVVQGVYAALINLNH